MNNRGRRTGFTLFELILAIALSATLLALIGMAINLYLKRVDMSRTSVEEAQLARSVLTMIADDLRATAIYQPQDVSSVQQLMASSASFDVDSIDEVRGAASGASTGTPGGVGGVGGLSAVGTSGGVGGASGAASSTGGETSAGSSEEDSDMPLGLSGGMGELYVDVQELPRGDELFGTLTGYTNAPMAASDNSNIVAATGSSWGSTPSPSDLKTIRYYVREGDRTNAGGMAATTLAPETQSFAGGLVRQEIPRAARIYAEQTGDSAVMQSGEVLVAPEVLQIQFRYYDGEQIVDTWDMAEEQALPRAIEVIIWLAAPRVAGAAVAYDSQSLLSTAREYRQTVFLPMAELSQSGASGGMSSASASSASGSSATGGTGASATGTSGFGAGTGQQ